MQDSKPAGRSRCIASLALAACRRLLACLALLAFAGTALATGEGDATAGKCILLLHSYHQGLPWTDSVHQGFVDGLGERARRHTLFVEYLDALRFPAGDATLAAFADRLAARYRAAPIDVLVATDDPAWRFLLANRERIAPGKPLLFAGVNNIRSEDLAGIEGIAGVAETPDFIANLQLMRRLHPDVDRLLVVGDATATHASNLAALETANRSLSRPFAIESIAHKHIDDALAALRQSPGDHLIFLMGRPLDAADRLLAGPEVARAVRGADERPIYSGWSFFLGYGIVGGRLVSGEAQGKAVAALTGELLAGKPLATLPRLVDSPNRFAFDHREFARFGIVEHQLPEGAEIIGRPARVWETHPKLFMLGLSLLAGLLFLSALQAHLMRIKRRSAALATRELTLMQTLMNAMPFPVFYKDASMRYRRCNDAFAEFLGKPREQIIGQGVGGVAQPGQASTFRSKDEELLASGGRQIYETQVTAADGTLHDVVFHKAVVTLPDGRTDGIVGAMLDVTEMRRIDRDLHELNLSLEKRVAERTAELAASNSQLQQAVDSLTIAHEELIRSEKFASLGAMVAGVAHELNTPIGNGLTVVSTLQEEFVALAAAVARGSLRRSWLDTFVGRCSEAGDLLMRNLKRAATLIANFKEVAVDQTSDRRRSFVLADIVGEIVQTFETGVRGKRPRFVIDVPETIVLDSYPGALGQILLNLFENARVHAFDAEAMGEVRIAAVDIGGRMQLNVGDNGRGIPPENLSRIFDPFFTTRLGTGGSGLGLAIVYRLVTHKLGGRIRVSSQPGMGTIFALELPLVAPTAETPETADGDEMSTEPSGDALRTLDELQQRQMPLHLRDELLDIRELVEARAAATAARNATSADHLHLRNVFERLDRSFEGDDIEAQVECDLAFHMAIIEITRDAALQKVGDAVIQLMYGHIRRNLDQLMPHALDRERLRRQHRAIYEAIVAGDPVAAGDAAAAHMAYVRGRSAPHAPPSATAAMPTPTSPEPSMDTNERLTLCDAARLVDATAPRTAEADLAHAIEDGVLHADVKRWTTEQWEDGKLPGNIDGKHTWITRGDLEGWLKSR